MMVLCGILLFHSDVKARFHFEKNNKTCNDPLFFFFFLLEFFFCRTLICCHIYIVYVVFSVCSMTFTFKMHSSQSSAIVLVELCRKKKKRLHEYDKNVNIGLIQTISHIKNGHTPTQSYLCSFNEREIDCLVLTLKWKFSYHSY